MRPLLPLSGKRGTKDLIRAGLKAGKRRRVSLVLAHQTEDLPADRTLWHGATARDSAWGASLMSGGNVMTRPRGISVWSQRSPPLDPRFWVIRRLVVDLNSHRRLIGVGYVQLGVIAGN